MRTVGEVFEVGGGAFEDGGGGGGRLGIGKSGGRHGERERYRKPQERRWGMKDL